jgi:hypothetical protein
MSETPKKLTKISNQQQVKSRIDANAVIIDPIDYSFRDLMHFEGTSSKLLFFTQNNK